jgi:myo-inositol-1(or 4)-monophosphatase
VAADLRAHIAAWLGDASELARGWQGRIQPTLKPTDPRQVLTEADLAISELLVGRVQATFPAHNLIDEEAGVLDRGSAFTWVIDPIDGTSNFAVGSPLYAIFIGLLEGGEPVAGGISLPALGQVFTAERGGGVFLNDAPLAPPTPRGLSEALVACSVDGDPAAPLQVRRFGALFAELALASRGVRSSNSGFDIGALLSGAYAAAIFSNGKVWDFVGPLGVLIEAGYRCTRVDGSAFDFSRALLEPETTYDGLLAAPGLHAPLLALLHQHLGGG